MNKTVFISNASSEIGKATAIFFARQDWKVAAAMPNPEKGKELLQFKNIKVYQLDVTQSDIADILEQIILDFSRIDLLISNICFGKIDIFESIDYSDISREFETCVFGLMKVVKAVLPYFRSQQGGKIITVLPSTNAFSLPLHTLYQVISRAVQSFSDSLSEEVGSFGIESKIFELPLLKSDFYDDSFAAMNENRLREYEVYTIKSKEKLTRFFLNSPPVENIPSHIYRFVVDDKKTIPPKRITNKSIPKNIKELLNLTIQKIAKKK